MESKLSIQRMVREFFACLTEIRPNPDKGEIKLRLRAPGRHVLGMSPSGQHDAVFRDFLGARFCSREEAEGRFSMAVVYRPATFGAMRCDHAEREILRWRAWALHECATDVPLTTDEVKDALRAGREAGMHLRRDREGTSRPPSWTPPEGEPPGGIPELLRPQRSPGSSGKRRGLSPDLLRRARDKLRSDS